MAAQLRQAVLLICALLTLVACAPGEKEGIRDLNAKGFDEPDPEDKEESNFWDYFYGHKVAGRESKEWKDYYKTAEPAEAKPATCGFWGNCADPEKPNSDDCNFYGNCAGKQVKQGWW